MKKVIVVAPHPDDETLGCGGTLLRHRQEGDAIHWIVATAMAPEDGFSAERIAARDEEIAAVAAHFGFESVHHLGFPTTRLDAVPIATVTAAIQDVVRTVAPDVMYLPFPEDVHTDHAVVFDATASSCKWFRHPSVKRILAYETLSETEFGLRPDRPGFRPNVFVDITGHLERKLEILTCYQGELGEFPFPRSNEVVRALAALRGATAGVAAAEAFMLLKEILLPKAG